MKFTRKISLFLAVLIILTAVSVFPVSAASIGDKLGNVLNTDIKVYIDGYQIPSYAVNNKMAVVMEDLANYGFNVVYDDKTRTLIGIRNYEKKLTPLKNIAANTKKVGSVAFPYVYTDITVLLNDKKIESFAINGRIVIYVDDLTDYGAFSWNDKKRELKLRLFDGLQTEINPAVQDKNKISEEIKRLAYQYSPHSTYILTGVADLTADTVNNLISLWYRNDNNFFGTLSMAVHETCHMFNGGVTEYEIIGNGIKYVSRNYEYDNDNNSLMFYNKYIIDNNILIVKYPAQKIKTEKATSKLPKNLRSFRWSTYVSPKSDASANVDGVYGLLNEFHSYYYGFKSVIDCHGYLCDYLDSKGYSETLVTGYFESFLSDALAFYEFKYWTLEYLLYLKEHYSDEYKSVMSNDNYKKAFIYIHDSFEKLLEDTVPKNTKVILHKLNDMNIESTEDNDTIWFGNTGRRKFTPETEAIKKQISGVEYINILNELRK